jgi:DNA primase
VNTGAATAFDRLVTSLEGHGSRVRVNGTKAAMAQCPAHDDRNPSLSLRWIEGSVLVKCFAGCTTEDVLAALNMGFRDLYDEPAGARYVYDDGRIVHRSPAKRFSQSGNTGGNALYRLTQVKAATYDERTVYVVEGERDVHAIEAAGGVATCNPMGAGKWSSVDPTPLHGGKVVIVADDDEPGRRHAARFTHR